MSNYFFKEEKVLELLNQIQRDLKNKKQTIQKAFDIDYKKWEVKLEIEILSKIIDNIKNQEYLPKFSKQEIVDGFGKIALVNTCNPYMVFNFILSCIYTNNKPCIILEEKLMASNKVIIELIRKSLEDLKYDSSIVEYKEVLNKEEIIRTQDNYDLIYYLGNKEEYLNFCKRIHVDSKFENFGEIYVYVDSDDFKEELLSIDKYAYKNEIKLVYYKSNLDEALRLINKCNNINKISVIFTKNTENAYEFIKKIKSEKIYINKNPEEVIYNINQNNLIFRKNIVLNK